MAVHPLASVLLTIFLARAFAADAMHGRSLCHDSEPIEGGHPPACCWGGTRPHSDTTDTSLTAKPDETASCLQSTRFTGCTAGLYHHVGGEDGDPQNPDRDPYCGCCCNAGYGYTCPTSYVAFGPPPPEMTGTFIGIGVLGALVLLGIIVGVVIYRKKMKKPESTVVRLELSAPAAENVHSLPGATAATPPTYAARDLPIAVPAAEKEAKAQAVEASPITSTKEKIEVLKELASLKEQGVLSEAEFQAQKANILQC